MNLTTIPITWEFLLKLARSLGLDDLARRVQPQYMRHRFTEKRETVRRGANRRGMKPEQWSATDEQKAHLVKYLTYRLWLEVVPAGEVADYLTARSLPAVLPVVVPQVHAGMKTQEAVDVVAAAVVDTFRPF